MTAGCSRGERERPFLPPADLSAGEVSPGAPSGGAPPLPAEARAELDSAAARPARPGAIAQGGRVLRVRYVAWRTPLLPWPFFGRRSLASLGAEGVASLAPGSPEQRLLVELDPRECPPAGAPAGESCFFLERGRVYEIRRDLHASPPRFALARVELSQEPRFTAAVRWPPEGFAEPIPGASGRAATIETVHHVVDARDADRPVLLTVVERTGSDVVVPDENR